ncbi:MAG: Ldh family oxidoreductase [Pseudomonadota bacterium]
MAKTRIPADDVMRAVARAFEEANTSSANATSVARALVAAEIDGLGGHGLSRIESYTAQSRSGKVDGHAEPDIRRTRPGTLMVDAAHGFAYPAIDLAVEHLPDAAFDAGIAAASIFRSHHAGAVGHHVERLARSGLIGMLFANTPKAMTPAGGRTALFGTNPIAFSAPRAADDPIIVDLALSEVARGKILQAAQAGDPIPEGWARDSEGRPTTDAKAALAGTLLPIGGTKGAALALMVELLAVAVGGARFASEAGSFFDDEGDPPGVGQLIIAIDPSAFAGRDVVLERIEDLASGFDGNGEARLPGSRKAALRDEAVVKGVAVDEAIVKRLGLA